MDENKIQFEYNNICMELSDKLSSVIHEHMKSQSECEFADMGQASSLGVLISLISKILANAFNPKDLLSKSLLHIEEAMNEVITLNKEDKNANTH